jgi:hypothetical protein
MNAWWGGGGDRLVLTWAPGGVSLTARGLGGGGVWQRRLALAWAPGVAASAWCLRGGGGLTLDLTDNHWPQWFLHFSFSCLCLPKEILCQLSL